MIIRAMCWWTLAAFLLVIQLCAEPLNAETSESDFTQRDIEFLTSFTLSALPALPAAPDNIAADNELAAKLGRELFFDPGLSANGTVSCASCHQPEKFFTDGLKVGQGLGSTRRNTPTLLGASYGPWKYWDGRKDSLWSQALEPLASPSEHGLSNLKVFEYIKDKYQTQYEAAFDSTVATSKERDTKTRAFVNVGKALMAYQRQIVSPPSKFDLFVEALRNGKPGQFSKNEKAGLRLFMGKAGCVSCHNGPLFTNFEFHNIGAPEANPDRVDLGRYEGIETLRNDVFNCQSPWSDQAPEKCEELNYLKKQGAELVGAFKTPTLRNVGATAPYMHAGQFESLEAVVAHYNSPTPPVYNREQHPFRPHFDVLPLDLNEQEQAQIVEFLRTLTSSVPVNDPWWQAP